MFKQFVLYAHEIHIFFFLRFHCKIIANVSKHELNGAEQFICYSNGFRLREMSVGVHRSHVVCVCVARV